ncbi:hypothetical protein Pint_27532 [Pistacia integerrima]|uniref:Uncharacterized protein n=1 Tax=Pistacia integerrima TaxID=434235 RepID=A0ACC0YMU8_9ROSI|nr:hypothetical protein Pint_27532 [Pistacia integerrima]
MEPHHPHQLPQQQNDQDASVKGTFLCRQTSTRWTPTTEQIRILKELYYNNGVRSPNADQIQKISARLRQYGKIEGKNVFYWFQNYKARERQKKRFINCEDPSHKFHNITSGGISASTSSSSNMFTVQHMGNYGAYGGSVTTTDKTFRECAGGFDGGIDPYTSTYMIFDKKKSMEKRVKEEEEEEATGPGIETLPLFPMHGEENLKLNPNTNYYSTNWYGRSNDANATSWTSLELSLNSYTK